MNLSIRFSVSALTLAAGLLMGAPADARTDCNSNANIAAVDSRLDRTIDQLAADRSDYGAHKGQAMGDLKNSRNELSAAQQVAYGDGERCLRPQSGAYANDHRYGRSQRGSNRNIWNVRAEVENMIDQLARDQRDYDGHRARAIADMQAARNQLIAAEQWQRR